MQPDEMTDDFYNLAYDHKNQNYSTQLTNNNKFDPNILEMPDDSCIEHHHLTDNSNNKNYNLRSCLHR